MSRTSAVWLVVAANLPDADILAHLAGREAYLVHHRGITHALAGVAVQFLVFAWLAWWLERRRGPAARHFLAPGAPWPAILAGLASHPVLDLLNPYGVRPWLPFSGAWVYGDLVFIVDPWLWLSFGAAAALGGRATRAGSLAYGIVAAAATIALFAQEPGRVPRAVLVAWPLALGVLCVARARGLGARRGSACVQAGLGVALVYLLLLGAAREAARGRAWAALRERFGPDLRFVLGPSMNPRLGAPLAWELVGATATRVYVQPVDLLGEAAPTRTFERNLELPALDAFADSAALRAWHVFARYPMVRVERDGALTLTDGRFWFTDFCALSLR